MSTSDLSRRQLGAIAAATLLVSLVGVGLSLMLPLLSLEIERMAYPSFINGLNTAMGGVGTILIAPFVAPLAARFGMKPLLAIGIGMTAASILLFHLIRWLPAWFIIRLFFGAGLCILFTLSEFWITTTAPENRRGLIMGIYASVLALGFASGPIILHNTGTFGARPYLVAVGLFLIALVPLMMGANTAPELNDDNHPPIMHIIRMAPAATLAALVFGAIETGTFSQLVLYGLRNHLNEAQAAQLVTAAALGGLLFQIPIGLLSDRFNRVRVLIACALAGLTGNLAMVLLPVGSWAALVVIFAWGGITAGLYTVGLALLGSRFTGAEIAGANAIFVMLYSAGMILGPPIVGGGMDTLGATGFPLIMALLLAVYAIFALRWDMQERQKT